MSIQLVSIFLKAKQTRIKLGRGYPQFFTGRFFQTKNGKSRQPLDGVDAKFTIITKTKTYSVVNFEDDSSHHKINELVKVLNEYEKEIGSSEK